MPSVAFITGITGQDGSYLTELLLQKGYYVHGLVRRSSTFERSQLNRLCVDDSVFDTRLFLHYADLSDVTKIRRIITKVQPNEFYHLAGQSHVGLSFDIPESTCEMTAMGTLRIMEILRDQPRPPRFLHASSREIFGTPTISPQDENTPVNPNSPYGCAKAFATQLVKVYRESHGFFFCNAICYNHESPRRDESFVTRKITLAAARIKAGLQQELSLGDLESSRDWGYAKDYIRAMWMILQQSQPDDFVLATGVSRTIRDLLTTAFGCLGLDWGSFVRCDDRFLRPADPSSLLGNSQKAREKLGWAPSITFEQMIEMMVDSDVKYVAAMRGREPVAAWEYVDKMTAVSQDELVSLPHVAPPDDDWTLEIGANTGLLSIPFVEIWQYRDLLLLLVYRDFVSLYKQTILGPLWFLIQPVLTTIVFTIVFGGIARLSTDGVPQILFYMSGIVCWSYFSECLTKTSETFTLNANIFGKVYFPRVIIPLSVVVSNLLRFGVQFLLFLGFSLWFVLQGASIHWNSAVLLCPLLVLLMGMLSLGMGMIVSSLTTKYRDLRFLLQFAVQLLMYATPVIYPVSALPARYRTLIMANPMSAIIETFRFAFLGSGSLDLLQLFYSAVVTVSILIVGVVIFNHVEKTFMDSV